MTQNCEFCRGVVAEGAKKCKICGEPFYPMGKVLKWAPLFSIAVMLLPFGLAYLEWLGREKATARAEEARSTARLAVSELHVKERAADRALADLARRLPQSSREVVLKDLGLPPRTTLEQLERQARKAPDDSDIQRKLFIYRALERPD